MAGWGLSTPLTFQVPDNLASLNPSLNHHPLPSYRNELDQDLPILKRGWGGNWTLLQRQDL